MDQAAPVVIPRFELPRAVLVVADEWFRRNKEAGTTIPKRPLPTLTMHCWYGMIRWMWLRDDILGRPRTGKR